MLNKRGIVDWVQRARAGDAVVYARGEHVPRNLGAAAVQLQDDGLVDLTRRRETGSGDFQFIMQRRRKAFAGGGRADRQHPRASAESTILRMILTAARGGQPCPTNAEFALVAGLSGGVAASYRLRKLVRDGKIALIDHGAGERRQAVHCKSGLMTARSKL